jgi:ACS family hexuronate transporter-like MFS transporter
MRLSFLCSTKVRQAAKIGPNKQEGEVVGSVRWGMLLLMFSATALNYIDRAALGIMQPVLSERLGWTTMDYANINFWFQVGYALGYLMQGALIDKFGVRKVFFTAVVLWSLATGAHGLMSSVVGFMICRLILGFTEAANYPAGVKISRIWFPAKERAIATGIFNAGTHVGAMITPVLLPFVLSLWGWEGVFYAMALIGISWSVIWIIKYYDPDQHPHVKQAEFSHVQSDQEPLLVKVKFREILVMRGTWAFAVAFTLTAPVFWFYLYWLPPYLNQHYSLGISISQIGLPLIVIYLSADAGSIAGGFLSSYLMTRGVQAVSARLMTMVLCAVSVFSVMAANSSHLWIAVLAISIGLAAGQAWITNIYSLVMDYTPRHMMSTVFGFGGMCAAIGGMFMTQVVGYILTVTGNDYRVLFISIPALYVVALVWLFFMAPRRIPVGGC